jgi:hypothetical protein
VAGVEISSDSIKAAKVNAEMNGLGEKTEWLCGKAEDIFGGLPEKGFEGGKSCVVVDVSQSYYSTLSSLQVIYHHPSDSNSHNRPYRRGHFSNALNVLPNNTTPSLLLGAIAPPSLQRCRTSILDGAIAPADKQPPRKGCDPPFLTQLLQFQPLTIVYVSCNVHTQARDVGWFIDHSSKSKEEKNGEYILESLRGFDLFPQVRSHSFLSSSFLSSLSLSFFFRAQSLSLFVLERPG